MRSEIPVPVLMYHSVGIPDPAWRSRYLTCPYSLFHDQMKGLYKAGFVTVSLQDLYEYVFEGKELPQRSVILTFDDGYADNWIFAYPAMRQFGFKGTVFVNPEFADSRKIVRKRLDEFGSADEFDSRNLRGFLSWDEMREAEKTGVFDIQVHAMTHTLYPVSDRIVDFRHPGDPYIWMTWNRNVEKKPLLQLDEDELIRFGEPVYEHGKSLSSPRYFPNEDISLVFSEYVRERGGKDFFRKPGWRDELFRKYEEIKCGYPPGQYEIEEEYRKRIYDELKDSKGLIEQKLGKNADFLCWPGGSGTREGVAIAKELGFKMSTAARDMPSNERRGLRNIPSQKSERIARLPAGLYWDGRTDAGSKIVYDSGATLVMGLLSYKKIGLAHIWGRLARKLVKEYRRLF